ncbi:YopX protein [Cellulophaga phage phi10:1]|uniref:YopX protein n=1 Tax=Cellulophaga phage phi10:1 TaxID=1327981 RepID=S0A0S2_9CAUD|nr:YopX protein [Cellulophaga phage phi10:1]AGO48410.1 YopX protein [Cellulophaga phage phi10:1]
MREIEFRGISIETNKIIYGSLAVPNMGTNCVYIYNTDSVQYTGELAQYEVYPESIGQHIDYKDKTEKKIFEGDIIRLHTGVSFVDDQLMKVCFHQGSFGLRSLEHDGISVFTSFTPMCAISRDLIDRNIFKEVEEVLEVVGNIHQNKELIK